MAEGGKFEGDEGPRSIGNSDGDRGLPVRLLLSPIDDVRHHN